MIAKVIGIIICILLILVVVIIFWVQYDQTEKERENEVASKPAQSFLNLLKLKRSESRLVEKNEEIEEKGGEDCQGFERKRTELPEYQDLGLVGKSKTGKGLKAGAYFKRSKLNQF